jgi:TP901 family phage tail tape measure protein
MLGFGLLEAVVQVKADSTAFDKQMQGLESQLNAMASTLTKAFGPLTSVLKGIEVATKAIANVIGGVLKTAFAAVSNVVNVAASAMSAFVQATRSVFQGLTMGLGMAVTPFTAAISVLAGVVTALGNVVVNVARGAMDLLTNAIQGAMAVLRGFWDVIGNIAHAIDQMLIVAMKAATFTAFGLTAAIAGTIKVAGDLESSYTSLRRVTGLTSDETAKLANNLQNIARFSPGASLHEINSIANFAGRLGVGGDTAKGKIAGITALTSALSRLKLSLDDFSVEEASTQMLRILKVFHLGVEDSERFASSLVALDNASTATGQELLGMVTRMSGVGATLKATIPQMLAMAAAMRDAGVDVASGTTAVSNLMMKMSGNVAKYANAVGLDVRKLAATMKTDPVKAVEVFLGALKRMSPEQQTSQLAALHMSGRMTGQILLQLAQNLKDVGRFTEIANREWQTMESLQSGVALSAKTAWAQLTLLGNKLMLIGAEIGKGVLPVFKALTDVLNNFADRGITQVKSLSGVFEEWAQVAIKAINMVGGAFEQWPNWLTVVELTFKDLGIKLLAIGEAIKNGLKSAFVELQPFFQDLFTAFAQMASNMASEIQRAFDGMWEAIKAKAGLVMESMAESAKHAAMVMLGLGAIDQKEHDQKQGAIDKQYRAIGSGINLNPANIMLGVKTPAMPNLAGNIPNIGELLGGMGAGLGREDRAKLNAAKGEINNAAILRGFGQTMVESFQKVAPVLKTAFVAAFEQTRNPARPTGRRSRRQIIRDNQKSPASAMGTLQEMVVKKLDKALAATGMASGPRRLAGLAAAAGIGGAPGLVGALGGRATKREFVGPPTERMQGRDELIAKEDKARAARKAERDKQVALAQQREERRNADQWQERVEKMSPEQLKKHMATAQKNGMHFGGVGMGNMIPGNEQDDLADFRNRIQDVGVAKQFGVLRQPVPAAPAKDQPEKGPRTAKERRVRQHQVALEIDTERRRKAWNFHNPRQPGQIQAVPIFGLPQAPRGQLIAGEAGKTSGLLEFAKHLQESVFGGGKGDAQKQLADVTLENVVATRQNKDELVATRGVMAKLSNGIPVKFAMDNV